MYALVKTGGKQFKAAQGEVIIVEKLQGEPGTAVELGEVIMVVDGPNVTLGSPFVKGAMVRGEIVRQAKGPKIRAYTYKAKKNEQRHWGHRQQHTHVRVTEVVVGS